MRAVILSLLFFCAAAVAGCEDDMAADEPAYFESPRQAVEEITVMLEAKDWPALSPYYDLEGSDIARAQLVSGEFFYRTERPEAAHPGGFWRYKHPFSPAFHYVSSAPAGESGIVRVMLEVEIDQGEGSPVQRGLAEFRMRESEHGYRVLPN